MSGNSSSMLLVGVGTAGTRIARGVSRAFGEGLRYLAIDTDASSGQDEENFLLLGGNRLSGRGAGGQAGAVRHGLARALCAADESLRAPLKAAGCLTRDPRMKERKKPGLRGARRRFQFSKR